MSIRDLMRKLTQRAATGAKHSKPAALSQDETTKKVTLSDGEFEYSFVYHTPKERRRAERMFDKEKGTIAWLKRELQPGDVFFDIGANIGVYTLFGARRIGDKGLVVAFEPHIPNANSLITNISLNNLREKVRLVTSALTDAQRFDRFNYQSLVVASSTSQFGRSSYEGEMFEPVFVEIKHGCPLDMFIDARVLPHPDVVKIDVDGLDYEVLTGMRQLILSPNRPRSIQIELGSDSKSKIMELMRDSSYVLKEKHWSQAGHDFIAQGNDPEAYPHYAIFVPKDRE
jgi:FkbM family methyltransferase